MSLGFTIIAESYTMLLSRSITYEKEINHLIDDIDIQIITTNKMKAIYNLRKLEVLEGDEIELEASHFMLGIYIYIYIYFVRKKIS